MLNVVKAIQYKRRSEFSLYIIQMRYSLQYERESTITTCQADGEILWSWRSVKEEFGFDMDTEIQVLHRLPVLSFYSMIRFKTLETEYRSFFLVPARLASSLWHKVRISCSLLTRWLIEKEEPDKLNLKSNFSSGLYTSDLRKLLFYQLESVQKTNLLVTISGIDRKKQLFDIYWNDWNEMIFSTTSPDSFS